MGNSQSFSSSDKEKYITARKIIESARNIKNQPLKDISNQLEQVFGIDHVPVSHRAQASLSPRESIVAGSMIKEFARDRRDKEYEQRISHLESELQYLRSVIEEMQEKSKEDSPIQNEVQENESRYQHPSQAREVNESRSRVSLTYFQTEAEDILGDQSNSRLTNPLNPRTY